MDFSQQCHCTNFKEGKKIFPITRETFQSWLFTLAFCTLDVHLLSHQHELNAEVVHHKLQVIHLQSVICGSLHVCCLPASSLVYAEKRHFAKSLTTVTSGGHLVAWLILLNGLVDVGSSLVTFANADSCILLRTPRPGDPGPAVTRLSDGSTADEVERGKLGGEILHVDEMRPSL